MEKEKIALIGSGGAARDILCQIIDFWNSVGKNYRDKVVFTESDDKYQPRQIMNCEVIPQSGFDPGNYLAILAVGDSQTRSELLRQLPVETQFASIIHPSCIISDWVEIGEGAVVSAGVILTCNIKIGKHAHINYGATISHDFVGGDFFSISPGANANGNCNVGNRVYIGSNAALRQGVNIIDDVTIGMGSVVLNSITKPGTYAGVPAVRIG